MAKEPKFKIKKDGTKIVEPDLRLKEKVGDNISNIITDDKVKDAERSIDAEGSNFREEMCVEVQELFSVCTAFVGEKFTVDKKKEDSTNFNEVKTLVLSIKSVSGMYGYDLATQVARSLFDYCEQYECIDILGKKIINIHVSALKVIYMQDIKADGGPIGAQLLSELKELVKQSNL